MTAKALLQTMIDKAWEEYNELHQAEADTGYADAMDGFERKEAEGYALGLEAAFELIFNESSATNVEPNYYPEESE